MTRVSLQFSKLLLLSSLASPLLTAQVQTTVTVAQLEEFLHSKGAAHESDAELAEQLNTVTLSEQLTPPAFARLAGLNSVGPQTTDQLRLLAAVSILCAPPAAELPALPAPDAAAQQQILESAGRYVNETLRHLPDFLATRETLSFNDVPERSSKHAKPRAILHFVGTHQQEIAYRNGSETDASSPPGFTTWGEFGPALKIALADSAAGTLAWSRWQKGEIAAQVAVFRYTVPAAASHYFVDFCCDVSFRGTPAYHGEISIDPATGTIERITMEPELPDSSSIPALGLAVLYGRVVIGGVGYVCPTRSLATSTVRIPDPEAPDGSYSRTYVNEVSFVGYHKFGSTARMVLDKPASPPR
jgi:hypothetical protein